MRNAQLIEMNVIVPPDMNLGVPYELVLTDPDGDRNVTIQIKKVGENMPINPKSILACLQKYFDEIERDAAVSPNTVCRKGCCGCCSNDFEISISEYFMILRFLNIKYGEDYVQSISEKAKMSFHADRCIFVNCTDGSCSIYEVRPLTCRKYGLYEEFGGCSKLDPNIDLLPATRDTSKNTLFFQHSKFPQKTFACRPKRIVHWFANLQNGQPVSEKMRDLFYQSFTGTTDEFIQTLV